jgi:hypothetical protein
MAMAEVEAEAESRSRFGFGSKAMAKSGFGCGHGSGSGAMAPTLRPTSPVQPKARRVHHVDAATGGIVIQIHPFELFVKRLKQQNHRERIEQQI